MNGFAIYHSPVGDLRVDYEGDAVTGLKKTEPDGTSDTETPLTRLVFRQLDEYFAGMRKDFDFPCLLRGTEFQQKVWAALREIPYGETRSYQEIARAVGNPRACRAVGMANHRNPIIIAVPCHRVIGANGALVGYGSGLDVKKALLELEQKHRKDEIVADCPGSRIK